MTRTLLSAPATAGRATRAGRTWHYEDGFLVNQFLGRFGHTPAWIVEVEGHSFQDPRPAGMLRGVKAAFRSPRVVRRNERRLAFAWPLSWPPPDEHRRLELVSHALRAAKSMGRALAEGCGVCGRMWEGGPTFVDDRARHICPDCAFEISRVRNDSPPSPLSTWLWCGVAGLAGLLIQILFHWSFGWSVVPLAVVAGWLLGSANGPNFDRHPLGAPLASLVLVFAFQALGLTMLAVTQFHFYQLSELTRIFVWTVKSLPADLWAGFVSGSAGLALALFERRLRKV